VSRCVAVYPTRSMVRLPLPCGDIPADPAVNTRSRMEASTSTSGVRLIENWYDIYLDSRTRANLSSTQGKGTFS